jgi:putative pyruvate formate lyase activating enzyme
MRSNAPGVDNRFIIDDSEPAYLALWHSGELSARVDQALAELEICRVCPRDCDINRLEDETSICHTGRHARVASAFAHHGEEDCLRGNRGSGTIFFAFCNLRCVFCQNWDISQAPAGHELSPQGIADLMLGLQNAGCHNINFVTPEHVVPQLVEAIALAVPQGLRLPLVYNTSAYDSIASLRLMEGLVDIYMPDFKFWTGETAERYAAAPDYPERARHAIGEMHRQVGPLRFGADGLARRGVLVRHLVMPSLGDESAAILEWLAREVSPDTWVNVMGQYHPSWQVGEPDDRGRRQFPGIDRRPRSRELEAAREAARRGGLWRLDERHGGGIR